MALAKTRLSGAQYVQYGYGQVEPNHLSARRTGQIYAQLPANKDITVLENGMFAKYDYANHEVNFTGAGEWMLVFNEVKVYRPFETDADFAMLKDNYEYRVFDALGDAGYTHLYGESETAGHVDGLSDGETMVPRLLKTNVGDIFTTNCIKADRTGDKALKVGDKVKVGADGYLTTGTATGGVDPQFVVVQVYVMPDLQPGVKLQRIA